MRNRLRRSGDQGETLLELIIAILILGVCVVAVGSGIAISIKMSDIHRKQAVASEFLHNYAEVIQASSYKSCTSGPVDYSVGLAPPTNSGPWAVTQKRVLYWNGTGFGTPCVDKGLQQVTLELKSADGFVDETIDVIVRNVNAT
jgi:type II secretory pathway pseudopilin PulG